MLKQEELDRFIGREKEIDLFKQWIENRYNGGPWIFYLHDALEEPGKKGGVGKTWLLLRYAAIAQELYPDIVVVHIDFFNVADRDGVIVADHVFEALKRAYPAWSSQRFAHNIVEYRAAIREGVEELGEVRERLSDALIADLRDLNARLKEDHMHLLVFFDTYENIEKNAAIAALRPDQSFPDNYEFEQMGVVIAGRNALDWTQMNWRGREYEVQTIAVSPFTPAEMAQYIQELVDVPIPTLEQYIQPLYERTEGRPILLGLVTDLLRHRTTTLDLLTSIQKEDFEASLVSQINNLEKPIDFVVMFMSHAYHRFNFALLDWILHELALSDLLQGTDHTRLARQLYNLSFVRHATITEGFVLHDEMRPLVNRYCWEAQDPEKNLRRSISTCVIKYYEHELEQEYKEQLRQAYYVEMLYHKLYLDLNDGFAYFERSFLRALNLWMNAFARSLMREIQQFASQMSAEQRFTLRYLEARLLQREEDAFTALTIYQELEQQADEKWLSERRLRILTEKARCYFRLSRYAEAVTCFSAALEQTTDTLRHISLLSWLGYTYRKQGLLDKALSYYEQSLEKSKRFEQGLDASQQKDAQTVKRLYAEILNNIGIVYRLQGKIDEALSRCKIGLRTRKELFKRGEISENYIGVSFNTIGAIYLEINDLLKAEQAFREASAIFSRTGFKKSMAMTSNRFGQIALIRGELRTAAEQFEKAYYMSLGVDTEAQIISLMNQARISMLEGQRDKSSATFQKAIVMAEQAHNYMQQAETLIEYAHVLAEIDAEKSSQAYEDAEKLCLQYGYNELRSRAKEYQGDSKFQLQEYRSAFQYYGEACRAITYHNAIRYQKILRKVIDNLLEIPYQEIDFIVDALISYWIEQGLNVDYPELINSCEEVKVLIK